jgi:RNA polymerase sigma factor (sigma-70 family)
MTEKEFKSLVLPFKNLLYFVAMKILDDQFEAEDIVQETYLKAWNARSKLTEVENLKAWLCRIARNLSIDRSKQRKRQNSLIPQEEVYTEIEFSSEDESSQGMVKKIFELLKHLPEIQATCFSLREADQLTYKEIASIVDLKESSVKVNVFRARKKLKALFLKQENKLNYGRLG